VKVDNFKASKDNGALKYLWARHRITLLSDYNRLRSNDARIREITELGLNYNLLTAYTSFVAVDNEVRNVNGKWTTVRQPLPLPEGVSDYAVGSPGPYPAAPVMQKSLGVMSARHKMESRVSEVDAAQEKQAPEKKDKAKKISIINVTSGKGLTKDEILKVAQAQIGGIEKCLAGSNLQGSIKLNLDINSDGTVKNVEIDSGKIKDAKLRQCIIDQVKKWLFPAMVNGKEVNLTLIVNIQ
jgi:Ca-activated chloride channel family protein